MYESCHWQVWCITVPAACVDLLLCRDSWDLSRCSPPAAIAFNINRWWWSSWQGSADAKDTVDTLSKSLSMDKEEVSSMDGDPTKVWILMKQWPPDSVKCA